MKKTLHNTGHRWTTDELKKLMSLWAAKEPLDLIAAQLNVTTYAILKQVQRLRREGIPLERRVRGHKPGRTNTLWTQEEVQYLIRRRSERATYDEIALDLGRTHNAILGMINKLRREKIPVAMMGNGTRRLWDDSSLRAFATRVNGAEIIEMDDARNSIAQ